jgi:hypothetical protein
MHRWALVDSDLVNTLNKVVSNDYRLPIMSKRSKYWSTHQFTAANVTIISLNLVT